ncbi:ABC transporter permease [Nonomuraea sp. NPDC050783]|uniref:ABC transporter permease n=1 Tax=Nonomuraea sp. NPDC050783 TaxID=3154634 RepID=UPI003466B8A3
MNDADTTRELTDPTDVTSTVAGPGRLASSSRPAPSRFSMRLLLERYLLVGVWIALVILLGLTQPDSFLTSTAIQVIFGASAVYVVLGLAAMCTTLVGEIDLAVPFIMGLAATSVPVLVSKMGFSVLAACAVALVLSAVAGLINGLLIVKVGVDAFIVTLASGTILLGLAGGMSHQVPVSGLPPEFSQVAISKFIGLPAFTWYGFILAIVGAYVLAFTPLGRDIAFVGANREVSRLAGIRVDTVRLFAYVLGSLLAGIAGVLLVAQLGGFEASTSGSYLLPTFAVLFLSAAVVRPGRFTPIGLLIAVYFIATGNLGIQLFGYSGWPQQLFYGGSLVAAVTAVHIVRRKSSTF